MPEEKQVIIFEVPPELHAKVKAEAERLGISLSGFLRQLLVKYFEGK